ncbi:MAG: hypothetical protein ACRENE_09950 [Polyangiaceae bacterium]
MRLVLSIGALALGACTPAPSTPVRAPAAPADMGVAATLEPCAIKLDPPPAGNERPARLSPDLDARARAPVLDGLCACAQADDEARLDVRIVPGEGEVRATAPDDERINACLAEHLRPGRFTAFDAPAGVESAVTAPAHMAPSHPGPVQKFRAKMHAGEAAPPPAPPPVILVYSLTLDRAHGTLRDAAGQHVPVLDDR